MSRACEFFDRDKARPVRVYVRVSEDGAVWHWLECELVSTGSLADIAEGVMPAGAEKMDGGEVNVRQPAAHNTTMLPENGSY